MNRLFLRSNGLFGCVLVLGFNMKVLWCPPDGWLFQMEDTFGRLLIHLRGSRREQEDRVKERFRRTIHQGSHGVGWLMGTPSSREWVEVTGAQRLPPLVDHSVL